MFNYSQRFLKIVCRILLSSKCFSFAKTFPVIAPCLEFGPRCQETLGMSFALRRLNYLIIWTPLKNRNNFQNRWTETYFNHIHSSNVRLFWHFSPLLRYICSYSTASKTHFGFLNMRFKMYLFISIAIFFWFNNLLVNSSGLK